MKFYQLDQNDLQSELETDIVYGLTKKQAESRLKTVGYNSQFSKPKFSTKMFNIPLLLISFIISVVYVIFAIFGKDFTLSFFSIAILVLAFICQCIFVLINFFLSKGIYLSSFNKPYTLAVIRDGVKCNIKYNEIVYGDIVCVEKGDYISFDGVILSSNGLVTDESAVTGNDRVAKHPGVIAKDNVTPEELSNTVFCGSYVVHGKAKIVVTDVASRVYLSKSGKIKSRSVRLSSKLVDFSNLFITIFSVFCVIFSIICGLIARDYVDIITSVMLFAVLVFSGFMKKSYDFIKKKAFLDLNRKDIFLNSYDDIENLNNTDILLLTNKYVFEPKVEISGFVSENLEYTLLSNVTKSNFSVFLYGAFSLEANSSEQKSCIKVLKKIGVDFDDLNSMCPTLASFHNDMNGVNISARAYEGNNMIIASGDYSVIKSMCDNSVSDSEIENLNHSSIEMLAVAVKNVDVISDDLSEQSDGFTLVGVLGINRKVDDSTQKRISLLDKSGIHTIVLFSGNYQSLCSAFSDKVRSVSMKEIVELSKQDFKNIDYIYDYNGDINLIAEKISLSGYSFSFVGDKLKFKHSISFKKIEEKPLANKDTDIVITNGFDSVFNSFLLAKKSAVMTKKLFENYSLFCAFFVICGVFFSLMYKSMIVNTVATATILMLILPVSIVMLLLMGVSNREITQDTKSDDFFGNNVLSYTILTSIIFLLLCTCLKFILISEHASAFMIISFVTYVCFNINYVKDKTLFSIISIVPSIVLSIVFCSPISFLFGYSKIGFVIGILALVVGIVLKFVALFISRSVKI